MYLKVVGIGVIVGLMALGAFGQQTPVVITPSLPELPLDPQRELTACDYLNGGLGSDDIDNDGIKNCDDNCIFDRNKDQKDKNKDGVGDACEWRERADEEWEKVGAEQRRTATEPVDLSKLVSRSDAIFLATVHEGISQDDPFKLGGWGAINIIRQLKGRPVVFQTKEGNPWVHFPDRGPKEIVGHPILLFLRDGKIRKWKPPHVYSGDPNPDGSPYVETRFFGYTLADLKFGVLGVSEKRISEIAQIVQQSK